jgi:para-nitrobenzyl esterase
VADSLGGASALRTAPVQRIVEVQTQIERERPPGSGGAMPFWPVVDGHSVSGHPLDEIASGAAAPVPLIVGSNLHETTLFLYLGNPAYRADPTGWSMPPDELVPRLAGFAGERGPRVLDAYRALHPAATDLELYVAISSDAMRLGAIRVAEAQFRAGRAPAYLYLFTWESPLGDGGLGATHGLEIPFVFRTIDEHFATRGAPGAEQVADDMSSAWCSFAACGTPATPGAGPWPAFSLPGRETMVFGRETAVVGDPHSAEREAWGV